MFQTVAPLYPLDQTPPTRQRPKRQVRAAHRTHDLSKIRAYAVAQERNRLGREMHDRLGQTLACASAFSGAAAEMLAAGHVDEANWALEETIRALQAANGDLREAICALRTLDIEPDKWLDSLCKYVALYEQQWGIRCQVEVGAGAAKACGAEGRVTLTRILQEALSNVRKHAATDSASINITLIDGWVVAEVADRGRGFDTADRLPGHYGLATMEERVKALGGNLTITSSPGGTRLFVSLPARCQA